MFQRYDFGMKDNKFCMFLFYTDKMVKIDEKEKVLEFFILNKHLINDMSSGILKFMTRRFVFTESEIDSMRLLRKI